MEIKDLNLDAQAIPESDVEEGSETSTEGSQPKQTVEKEESTEANASSEAENSEEETVVEARVPYSRFETVNTRAIQAETELNMLKQQIAEGNRSSQNGSYQGDLPEAFVELYGDSDASRRVYELEQKRFQDIEEKAAERAVERLAERQAQLAQQEEQRVAEMENAFDDFASKNKRTFSDAEQSAILDVIDDFTPKDDTGHYLVDPMQYLDKAVEVYDLRAEKAQAKTKESKRRATSIASASSEGDATNQTTPWTGNWWDSPMLPKD